MYLTFTFQCVHRAGFKCPQCSAPRRRFAKKVREADRCLALGYGCGCGCVQKHTHVAYRTRLDVSRPRQIGDTIGTTRDGGDTPILLFSIVGGA